MLKTRQIPNWLYDALLVFVILIGAGFRLTGLNWDDNTYNHPDERFLVTTTSALAPVSSLADFFNTSTSTLNPDNRGSSFFVYGTLPLFLVRYAAEIVNKTDSDSIKTIGRIFSACMDLGTILLAYLMVLRLYKRRTALLAAVFGILAVLEIQQSHFFTVDTFANFFIFLAIYFAIRIGTTPPELENETLLQHLDPRKRWLRLVQHPWFGPSVGFGLALGAAMACKLNAAPVALMLPAAVLLQLFRHPRDERSRLIARAVLYVALGALFSLLAFRCFQPYAFNGPSFFNVSINSDWITSLKSLSTYSSRDVDYYPPAYQWARRPVWFSLKNMVLWGVGLPLGILAWVSFLWAGWRMLKGEFRQHCLLWGWTACYFVWQSLAFNATMRYQLPIYPCLAIFAAWGVMQAWDWARSRSLASAAAGLKRLPWRQILVGVVGGIGVLGTLVWALAFTSIYTRPLTRVAASEWIFQNLPGPLTVRLQTATGVSSQPLSVTYNTAIQVGTPYQNTFVSNADGQLDEIYLAHVLQASGSTASGTGKLHLSLSSVSSDQGQPYASVSLVTALNSTQDLSFVLATPFAVNTDTLTLNILSPDSGSALNFCQPVTLKIATASGEITQSVPAAANCTVQAGQVYSLPFQPKSAGTLESVTFSHVSSAKPGSGSVSLMMLLTSSPWQETVLTTQTLSATIPTNSSANSLSFKTQSGIKIEKNGFYLMRVWVEGDTPSVMLEGTALANEGDWDDGLPFRIDGYDAFGGIYVPNLDFNMYDDDNAQKLQRFESILDSSEYLAISSNRQWGSLTRLPERFPLTTTYYRDLLGCPADKEVTWCYSVAEPGMFTGTLGYKLVQVFTSYPSLGSLTLNDTFAEEAFTVYDHPKVFIFEKESTYSATQTHALLDAVDLTKIVPVKPGQAGSYPANLMLPAMRWVEQEVGGTWSALFSSGNLLNQSQVLAVIVWYLAVALLGLIVYPIVRLAFSGLSDHGYSLSRLVGLLLLALLVWLAGSAGIAFTRTTISLVLLLLLIVGVGLAYLQREALRAEWKANKRYYLAVELIILAFFALDLGIRLGNPDLWHPAYGGEKPMDFSFFNAVLKSTTFPPYDPWFAGGYMNYYYYGYVVVGVLVKWLGITPSVAYNLVLPTLFSLLAIGGFSIGWNLSKTRSPAPTNEGGNDAPRSILKNHQLWVGITAAVALALIGNLGTVRMIWQGLQQLVMPVDVTTSAPFLTRCGWAIQGFFKWLGGQHLPYSAGDWYWKPSRAIQPESGNEITEFPFFSFLYGDLHASTMSQPIAALAVNWALAVFLGKGHWGEANGKHKWLSHGLALFVGAVIIGSLKPTNTWDIYTYLPLGIVALIYAVWCITSEEQKPVYQRLIQVLIEVAVLTVLTILLYKPFSDWYGQAYTQVDPWTGNHTVIWSYLVHWGVFLFILASWFVYESFDWMASTPLSSLSKLLPYRFIIAVAGGLVLAVIVVLMALVHVQIAWLVLLMAVWAAILIFRPGMPDTKRAVLFLTGTALVLTLVVELVVLHGDINRQNTVFKLYLQAWTLFSVSAAVALGWLWQSLRRWHPRLRIVWQVVLALLLSGAVLCTVTMAINKIKDRMAPATPLSLDGMAYMQYATYTDGVPNSGTALTMDLSQDYDAIKWMQQNVQGSPVIVEANIPIYHWGSRFTIYTGLPGVLGWDWHEEQQRALAPSSWVTDRETDIAQFYQTTDTSQAKAFLKKYGVTYIIVGQYERLWYAGDGLNKFEALNGTLWKRVYQEKDTAIYKVIAP